MADESHPALEVLSVETGYGNKQVLNGVDLVVPAGQIVAVIGHNGAGNASVTPTTAATPPNDFPICWQLNEVNIPHRPKL